MAIIANYYEDSCDLTIGTCERFGTNLCNLYTTMMEIDGSTSPGAFIGF